jgi:ribose transport system ATP-binding protein
VRRGEIAAVCGAMGSGRTALLSTLFGCGRGVVTGKITIDGAPVALDSPRRAIAQGIAFVPEDRKAAGLVAAMSVGENLALPSLASSDVMGQTAKFGLVDRAAERRLAERRIAALRIRGEASSPVSTLSGGNQQKTVLGKWLERPPKLLLLDEPTRGVDVGAREEIYEILATLARNGVAILLASSDYSEVLRLAARIFILRAGKGAGELDAASATQETIVSMCSAPLAMHLGAPA